MTRKDILKKLDESALDKDKIIIISGASLVVQRFIKNTSDIDLACDGEYYKSIKWNTKLGAFNLEIKYNDIFEISNNLYFPNDVVIINGYKFLSVEKCIEIKEKLGREKDKELIKRFRNY